MDSKTIEKEHLVAVPTIVTVSSLGRGKLNRVLPIPTAIDFITEGDSAEVFEAELDSGKALVYLFKENKKEKEEPTEKIPEQEPIINDIHPQFTGIIIGLNLNKDKELWGIGLSQTYDSPHFFSMSLDNIIGDLVAQDDIMFIPVIFNAQDFTSDTSHDLILQSISSTRFDKASEGDKLYEVTIEQILLSFCQDKLVSLIDLPQWHEEHKKDSGRFLLIKATVVEKERNTLIINDTEFKGGVRGVVPTYLDLSEVIEKDTEVYLTGRTTIKDDKLFIDVFGIYPLITKDTNQKEEK